MLGAPDHRERRRMSICSTARGLGAAIAAAALAAGACGDDPGGTGEAGRSLPEDGGGVRAVTPARYVTDVTFVPFSAGGRSLHYRFRNRAASERLARDYGGWALEADGWRPLLAVRDSLPVPRAGWRVLPADGLRVLASRGGGLGGLRVRDGSGEVRLELGRTLARWESPTGQTERFRLATVGTGEDAREGLAVERRSARTLEMPPPRGLYGFLLVADSTGQGLVILRHGGTPPGRRPPEVDTTAVAYGWTDEGERTWSEVRLAPAAGGGSDAGSGSPPASWEVAVPAGGVRGRLSRGSLRELADAPAGPGDDADDGARDGGERRRPVRLYALSGTLNVHGVERTVRGVGVEAGEP
jgi:hypothetical protein